MCKCVIETEKALREKLEASKEYEGKIIKSVATDNWSYLFGVGIVECSPITVEYEEKTKKGYIRRKKKTIKVTHTYCPSCGEKHDIKITETTP